MEIELIAKRIVLRWAKASGTHEQLEKAIVRAIRLCLRRQRAAA
jgi:hypothetical protein